MTVPTTPLTYNGYVTQVATMAVTDVITVSGVVVGVDASFNAIIPQMLNYAELRIQRDLDLLPSLNSRSYSLTANSNKVNIPVEDFVTIQTVEINSDGYTVPLLPTSKEVIQNVYGSPVSAAVPVYFAMYGGDTVTGGNTSNVLLVGPYSDSSYPILVTGTSRLPTLYKFANSTDASSETTFISSYLPDLLVMASMIYISAFQRNFGRQSDDPAMAQSYESQYKGLLMGAGAEEYRKKFAASAWSSTSTSPVATPTR